MAEIAPEDLPEAVRARFDNDDTAQAAIDEVLAAARRWCGWHVSPRIVDDVIDMDGPGGHVLSLPTLNLVSVSSVTELGHTVDVALLDVSRRKGTLSKRFCVWTSRDGSIEVTATHGFTEAEAADWRRAVIKVVDSWSQTVTRDTSDLKRKKVNNVEYEWFEALVSTDHELSARFSPFRILLSP